MEVTMNRTEISALVQRQRDYFSTGATLPVEKRIRVLKNLRATLKAHEVDIAAAVEADLGKCATETFMCETGMVISELSYMLAHIRRFAREQNVLSPLPQFPSRSYRKPCPYGVTLIMPPWNYPVLLTLGPLVSAIAAGNTAIVKPSAYSPITSIVLSNIIEEVFEPELVTVVTGGRDENNALLEEKFDYIFFTGGKTVGKLVLEKAARHLTPVTLELGGKSPCIVDQSAHLRLAARRIVFGKYLNCGQTCVAPDYLLVHSSVKEQFLCYLVEEIHRQYDNAETGRIVSRRHFDRLMGLIDPQKVLIGGDGDTETLKIQPTVLDNVTWDDAVMQEEIFGPILPVLTFESIEEVIDTVNSREKPLALYIYAQDKAVIHAVTSRCIYGGGCVNDCVIHLATSRMGFGGVGKSGMGEYHGKTGFDTFTHYKSIVDKKTWLDLPMRYQPYAKVYDWLIHLFLR